MVEDCGEEFDIEMWVERVGARAPISLHLMHWILKVDVSRVRRYVDVEEPDRDEGDPAVEPGEGFVCGMPYPQDGQVCSKVFTKKSTGYASEV